MSHVTAQLGGFGWKRFASPNNTGTCVVADSADIFDGTEEVLSTWSTINKSQQGYDPVCDCYCWGYMPPPVQVMGLGKVYNNAKWRICDPRYSSLKRCCGTAAAGNGFSLDDCPDCPPPATPPPTLLQPQEQGLGGKYGITLGWLLAAGVVGGGGYYAYKKGVFKKKRRKKR